MLRIGFAQINPTVGDLAGNQKQILSRIEEAEAQQCDLILFPELALTGYPPEDLLLKPAFVRETQATLEKIAKQFAIGFHNPARFVTQQIQVFERGDAEQLA